MIEPGHPGIYHNPSGLFSGVEDLEQLPSDHSDHGEVEGVPGQFS